MKAPHVLLLDPDPLRRDHLAQALRTAGCTVVTAEDGPRAGAALAVPGIDMVVLDLGLADLDSAALRQALAPAADIAPDSLEAAERRHLAAMLRHTRGNKRRAAQLLGIARSTLLAKVRKYGLDLTQA
jgi:DNA-binding NtrC family response regulator